MEPTARDPRRLPHWREVGAVLPPRPRPFPSRERRLAAVADLADMRRLAWRRAPRVVFDYVDGAAEAERSLARSVAAFARAELRPRVLRDVSEAPTAVEVLGKRI